MLYELILKFLCWTFKTSAEGIYIYNEDGSEDGHDEGR